MGIPADRPRILVTPRSLTAVGIENVPELAPLTDAGYSLVSGPSGRTPTGNELIELLDGCVGYLAGVEPITAEVLSAAADLIVISRNGVGTDAIDSSAARANGVAVEIARAANSQGVAELSILHMLAALRGYPSAVGSVKKGEWVREKGGEIAGRTVGIVGLGAIGRTVATAVAAIGATVVAADPFVTDDDAARIVDVDELFAIADIVTLHSPPGERPLVSRSVLDTMRPGATLINTARSGLVDDEAVLDALKSGQLAAYAVDAYDSEPPERTPLLEHPHCLPTPHIGGYTAESVHRATAYAVDNLLRVLGSR